MSNPIIHKPCSITVSEMCVVEKCHDGSLRSAYCPVVHNAQTWSRLAELRRDFKDWEDEQGKQLVNCADQFLSNAVGTQEMDVRTILGYFWNAVSTVYRLMGSSGNLSVCSPQPAHEYWRDLYKAGVHLLPECSGAIRGFDVTRGAVYAYRAQMDEEEFLVLEQAYYLASGMKPCLLTALDEYERRFFTYVKESEKISPRLFERRSFCRDFSATFGYAELDFDISFGNQCIVESLEQYYWALVLERLYQSYEATDSIVAYSHRKLGWHDSDQSVPLEPRGDLRLIVKSNFGFGKDRYFGSVLSYKGLNAINVPLVLFFHGVGKVGVFDFTYIYKVEEASFETCFDGIVRLNSEYRSMGQSEFLEKYYRQPLQDLADLLIIVAHTDSFLKINTLDRFDALTSGPSNELMPSQGFSSVILRLNASEERTADLIVQTLLPIIAAGKGDDCANDSKVQELLNEAFDSYALDSLQLIVKKDLFRNYIIKGLASALSNGTDIGELAKGLIPDDGISVETYEGYELISMRVDKALLVISPIERLRAVAALTAFESAIDSIVSTCLQIGDQAKSYISQEIEPELMRLVPECNRLKSQLSAVNAEIEKEKYHGVPAWLTRQSQNLKAQVQNLDVKINDLEKQKQKLSSYMRTVSLLRSAD